MVAPGGRAERRVAMTRLRARIAERMVEAQQTAAMLTTFNEVDLTAVMALRSRYKDAFEKQHGVRLGFMGFFVKAAIEALQRYPGGQCVGRRQRDRLSRLLRHRHRGIHRPRAGGPGPARRGPPELSRDRDAPSTSSAARRGTARSAWRT